MADDRAGRDVSTRGQAREYKRNTLLCLRVDLVWSQRSLVSWVFRLNSRLKLLEYSSALGIKVLWPARGVVVIVARTVPRVVVVLLLILL